MQDITQDSATMDSIYKHDKEEQNKILAAKPWATEYPPPRDALLNLVPIISRKFVFQQSHSSKWLFS